MLCLRPNSFGQGDVLVTRMCVVVISEVKALCFFIGDDVSQKLTQTVCYLSHSCWLFHFRDFNTFELLPRGFPGVSGVLSEIDHSANGVAVRGKGEAGQNFGVVTTVVLHRETKTAVLRGKVLI